MKCWLCREKTSFFRRFRRHYGLCKKCEKLPFQQFLKKIWKENRSEEVSKLIEEVKEKFQRIKDELVTVNELLEEAKSRLKQTEEPYEECARPYIIRVEMHIQNIMEELGR